MSTTMPRRSTAMLFALMSVVVSAVLVGLTAPAEAAPRARSVLEVTCATEARIGQAITCTAVVRARTDVPATGVVTFTSSKQGAFSDAGSCTLQPLRVAASECSITYTPQGSMRLSRNDVLKARYSGDPNHLRTVSNRVVGVGVTPKPRTAIPMEITCDSSATTAQVSKCQVFMGLEGNAALEFPRPSGAVTFTSSEQGTFVGDCPVAFNLPTLHPLTGVAESGYSCEVGYVPQGSFLGFRTDTITAHYSGAKTWLPGTTATSILVRSLGSPL